jgi:hypothetical protein
MNSPTIAVKTCRPTEPRRFSSAALLIKSRKTIAWLLISTLSCSCCTTALWDATDPNETIEVSPDEVTEAALTEDGFTFHRDEASGYFHIEKTAKQKAGDYSLRAVGTPVAVSADALLSGLLFVACGMAEVDPASLNWSAFNM